MFAGWLARTRRGAESLRLQSFGAGLLSSARPSRTSPCAEHPRPVHSRDLESAGHANRQGDDASPRPECE